MSLAETLSNAELRTHLALRQIDEIKRGEHTHEHPKVILAEIAEYILENFESLKRAILTGDSAIIRNQAANLIIDLDNYLPLLGFILRSSNVRNAFEVFDPLIAMCSAILGKDVRLIYSSEWDYSPFTRTFTFPKLQNVVVVGLPAHESCNILIVPVVGHELGHAKWKRDNLLSTEGPKIERDVVSYFVDHLEDVVSKKDAEEFRAQANPEVMVAVFIPEVGHAQYYAKLQCEEVFCDIVGTRIFGASYLRAFAYLIFPSPKALERQSFDYPSNGARVRFMKDAARFFGTPVPEEFGDNFEDVLPRSLVGSHRQMMLAADDATERAFPRLLKIVDGLFADTEFPKIDDSKVSSLMDVLSAGRPGNDVFNLPDVIEAGWRLHLKAQNETTKGRRFEALHELNEVVFKTIEVSEFYRHLNG